MANQETEGVYSKPFITPDTLDVNALLRKDTQYIGRCIQRNDDLQYLSTANVARDFDAVRAAVGDKKMTYLGFSYGTFLGATIQSLFPGRTRAVVLDGALDPDQYMNDPLDSLDEQTAGFERAISRFMISCAAHQDLCPFGGGDVKGTLDDLIEQADATPIPASNAPDRPVDGDDIRAAWRRTCTRSTRGTSCATPSWCSRPATATGSARSRTGSSAATRTGATRPGTDRYFLLSADEQNYPRGIEPFLKAGKASYQDYDYAFWNHGYAELNWGLYPIRARDKFDGPFRTSRRDPTTLVVGTKYDPATPYKEAKRLVQQLGNARLLTMKGDGHTAYDGDPARRIQLASAPTRPSRRTCSPATLPAEGTKCGQDCPDFRRPGGRRAVAARRVDVRLVIARGTRPLRLP